MNTCRNCKFFETVASRAESAPSFRYDDKARSDFGYCSRWRRGYHEDISKLPSNEVIVEDDEMWGAIMGPDFGCVLWEPREATE